MLGVSRRMRETLFLNISVLIKWTIEVHVYPFETIRHIYHALYHTLYTTLFTTPIIPPSLPYPLYHPLYHTLYATHFTTPFIPPSLPHPLYHPLYHTLYGVSSLIVFFCGENFSFIPRVWKLRFQHPGPRTMAPEEWPTRNVCKIRSTLEMYIENCF